MILKWQYKNNDYTVDIKEQPLFGDLKLGSEFNVKMLDGQQFELVVVKVEEDVYFCEVISCNT